MKRLLKSMLLVAAVLVGQNAWGDNEEYKASDAETGKAASYTGTSFNFSNTNAKATKGYSTASSSDSRSFSIGFFPSGGTTASGKFYTLTAKQNLSKIIVYYTMTNSDFASKDQSKSGDLIYQIGSNDAVTSSTSGNKSNETAYIETIEPDGGIAANTDIKLYSSANRLVVFSVVVTPAGSTPSPTESAPSFTTNLNSTADVYVGVATTFTVVADGNPTPTYQWYKDDVAISGATGASYDYTATSEGSAKIHCVASNTVGDTKSTECTVTATKCDYLVKAVVTGATSANVAGTMTGATASVNLKDYKLNATGRYFGVIAPTGQYFLPGDVVKIHLTTAAGQGNAWCAFSSSTASSDNLIYSSTENIKATDLSFTLTSKTSAIYFARNDNNGYNWNPTFGYIQVERPQTVSVTITSAGRATLYSDQKLVVPSGVTAYTYLYDSNTGTLVRGTEINTGSVLPANQGYVIKGTPKTYYFTVSDETAVSVTSDLTGSATEDYAADGATYYGLNVDDNGKFDFYLLENGTNIPAGKAYFSAGSGIN